VNKQSVKKWRAGPEETQLQAGSLQTHPSLLGASVDLSLVLIHEDSCPIYTCNCNFHQQKILQYATIQLITGPNPLHKTNMMTKKQNLTH
jgi:hypothetical protein